MNTRIKIVLGIVIALVAIGVLVRFQGSGSEAHTPIEQNLGADQTAVTLGDATVIADVAATADTRAQGLSGRSSLAEGEGMLFVFDEDDRHSFWMKDMLITIDMIWLSKDKQVVHIVPNAKPDSYPASYAPYDNARYVLEVPAGWKARHGVTLGSIASF